MRGAGGGVSQQQPTKTFKANKFSVLASADPGKVDYTLNSLRKPPTAPGEDGRRKACEKRGEG